MNILLHICCAPCAIFPIKDLRAEGHQVSGYFYNPNIHPYSEYIQRKEALRKYAEGVNMVVTYDEYDLDNYFQHILYNDSSRDRCPACWWMRLSKAAAFAKENEFDAFTTTLLGSPYQDQEILRSIGEEISKNVGIGFMYKDFRSGFNEGRNEARSNGIYMQKYCGCLYSERDRVVKLEAKK